MVYVESSAFLIWQVPSGEDNTGVNDRHWLASRRDAEGVFRRWEALVGNRSIYHQTFFATTKVRPAFQSSECFNKLYIQYHKVGVARFPNVALLSCCASSYTSGSASSASAFTSRCFAKGCHAAPCPSRPLPTASCAEGRSPPSRYLSFKYFDEGLSAILHATALATPGARYEATSDGPPKRLHLVLPAGLRPTSAPGYVSKLAAAGLAPSPPGETPLYTCKTCEGGPEMPDPVSTNVTSCLFRGLPYATPTLEAARKVHPCRYFGEDALAAVCRSLGDVDVRRKFSWFCADVERRVQLAEDAERARSR